MRLGHTVKAALAAAVMVPAFATGMAQAAGNLEYLVGPSYEYYRFSGDSTADTMIVDRAGSIATGNLTFQLDGAAPGIAGSASARCTVSGSLATCTDDVEYVEVAGYDGDDTITITDDFDDPWCNACLTNHGAEERAVIDGGNGHDTVQASAATADVLNGGEGNDSLNGGGGDDSLHGGNNALQSGWCSINDSCPPPEVLDGQAGNDSVLGEAGHDTVRGGDGNDTVDGGGDNDTVEGGGGDDTVQGNAGNDTVLGGDGADTVWGGAGSDIAKGEAGDDTVDGGTENDAVEGNAGSDALQGGGGDDFVNGGAGDDGVIDGGAGVDTAFYDSERPAGEAIKVTLASTSPAGDDGGATDGAAGARETLVNFERAATGAGDDTLVGSGDDNHLDGRGGNDVIEGRDGNDWLIGGDGDDDLRGGDGSDRLTAGAGQDVLDGGLLDDLLEGDGGTDTADYSSRAVPVAVTLNAVADDDGDASDANAGAGGKRDTTTGIEVLTGGSAGDTLTGSSGPDRIEGNGGDDTIAGGAGDDVLNGGDGGDAVDGGDGRDAVSYAGRAAGVQATVGSGTGDDGNGQDGAAGARDTLGDIELLIGTDHADVLAGDADANELQGGAGDDTLRGGEGTDLLIGGGGAGDVADYSDRQAKVTATLDATANDGVTGENDDVRGDIEGLRGGSGDDELTGSNGADRLEGGAGADRLEGLFGADSYAAGTGDDTVLALDGIAETADCGEGNDTGKADQEDTLTSCEGINPPVVVVDADGDGFAREQDCNDGDRNVHPAAAEVPGNGVDDNCDGGPAPGTDLDRDGDGFIAAEDCNDADPAVRPGGTEVPGNGVDENCDRVVTPFPRLDARVQYAFKRTRSSLRFVRLQVVQAPKGATVVARCAAKGKRNRRACAFKVKRLTVKRAGARVDIAKALKRRRLPVGTRLTVEVSMPGMIGRGVRFTVRRGKDPALRVTCREPGGKRVAC